VLSHAWSRSLFGNTNYNPPSRFLAEIPEELIEREGNTDSGADSQRYSYRSQADRGYAPTTRLSRTGPSVTPVSSAHMQTENHGLRIGDEIVHPTFGEGIIINIRGQGEKAEAAIRFRLVAEKVWRIKPLRRYGVHCSPQVNEQRGFVFYNRTNISWWH
jgi:DNA helicase-2/ATP-dependent DNA helicase PcrA